MLDPTPSFNDPFEFDMLMLEPVHHMMLKGMRSSHKEKKRLQEEAIEDWEKNQDRLDWVVFGKGEDGKPVASLNVESKKWVPKLLYEELGLPSRKKQGKLTSADSALRELLAICKGRYDVAKTAQSRNKWARGYITCRMILNIRQQRKKISSFLGLEIKAGKVVGVSALEDRDGRIRSTVSVAGTKTARFTHSKTLWGTGLNVATFPAKLKSMIVPDPGYDIAEFDLNRGESWIYAHLSEDPELLRIHTEGLDFHSETASTISGVFGHPRSVEWIVEHKNGEAYKLRYVGKRINHASAYRMRSRKGAESVNKEADDTGISVTVSQYTQAHGLWLSKYWGVQGQWWPRIEDQLSKTRTMHTPYGRQLMFHEEWGDKLFRDATAYVPQSTSVDFLNRGFLKVYHRFVKKGAWDLSVLAQTHDSILVQYRQEHRDEALRSIAATLGEEQLTINGRTFSIPIEAAYGPNWKDIEEYDLAA